MTQNRIIRQLLSFLLTIFFVSDSLTFKRVLICLILMLIKLSQLIKTIL